MPIVVKRASSPVQYMTVADAAMKTRRRRRLKGAERAELLAEKPPRNDPRWRPVDEVDNYPTTEWIHLADGALDALIASEPESKYWKISGDNVLEMSAAEKTAFDDAEAAISKSSEFDDYQNNFELASTELYKEMKTKRGNVTQVCFFKTDNGDGTYSDLVQELKYNYDHPKKMRKLLSISLIKYDPDGNETSNETVVSYKTAKGGTVVVTTKYPDLFASL